MPTHVGKKMFWMLVSAAFCATVAGVALYLNEAIWQPRIAEARLRNMRPPRNMDEELYEPEEITFEWMATVFEVDPGHPLRDLYNTTEDLRKAMDDLLSDFGTVVQSTSGGMRALLDVGLALRESPVHSAGSVFFELTQVCHQVAQAGGALVSDAKNSLIRSMSVAREHGSEGTQYTGFAFECAQCVSASVEMVLGALYVVEQLIDGAERTLGVLYRFAGGSVNDSATFEQIQRLRRLSNADWHDDFVASAVMLAEARTLVFDLVDRAVVVRNTISNRAHVRQASMSSSVSSSDRAEIMLSASLRLVRCGLFYSDMFYRASMLIEGAFTDNHSASFSKDLVRFTGFEMTELLDSPHPSVLALRWLSSHGYFLTSICRQGAEYLETLTRRGGGVFFSGDDFLAGTHEDASWIASQASNIGAFVEAEIAARRHAIPQDRDVGIVMNFAVTGLQAFRRGPLAVAERGFASVSRANTDFAASRSLSFVRASDVAVGSMRLMPRILGEDLMVGMENLHQSVETMFDAVEWTNSRAINIRNVQWRIDVRLRLNPNNWGRHGRAGFRDVVDIRMITYRGMRDRIRAAIDNVRAIVGTHNYTENNLRILGESVLVYAHNLVNVMNFIPQLLRSIWRMVQYIGDQAFTRSMSNDVEYMAKNNRQEEIENASSQIMVLMSPPIVTGMKLYLARFGRVPGQHDRVSRSFTVLDTQRTASLI